MPQTDITCIYLVFTKEVIIKIIVDFKVTVLYKFDFLIVYTQIENFIVHIIYHAVKTYAKFGEESEKYIEVFRNSLLP